MSCSEFRGLVQELTGAKADRAPATAAQSAARTSYSQAVSSTNRLMRPQPIRAGTVRSIVASMIEARLTLKEKFPALNHTPIQTRVHHALRAVNLSPEYKICQLEAVDSMSGLPRIEEDDGRDSRQLDMMTVGVAGESMGDFARIHLDAKRKAADLTISDSRISRIKEDDASHSRQKDLRTASVTGKSRVDVSPAISRMTWKLPVIPDKRARFRSLDGKLEENLRGDPSM